MNGRTKMILRWLGMPIIVSVAFVSAAIAALFVAKYFGLWEQAFMGFVAALAVVLVAYWSAPSHQLIVSVCWLILGMLAALYVLKDAYYPEGFKNAYEHTYWPLACTYLGGLIGLVLVALLERKRLN